MKHVAVTIVAALALAAAAAAPSLTGNWTMHVTGGPHGDATMGLSLKQDGSKVAGTFVSGHGPDMAVAGEFVNGELSLETTAGADDVKILFSAKLKQDGTLAGSISSPVGDMKWTASRAEAKDRK